MDFGENDRLDNKRSFAAFALRLAIEALDRVGEGEKEATSLSVGPSTADESPIEQTAETELGTEEWEGAISWGSEKKTVSQSLKKIDLASLIDWDE